MSTTTKSARIPVVLGKETANVRSYYVAQDDGSADRKGSTFSIWKSLLKQLDATDADHLVVTIEVAKAKPGIVVIEPEQPAEDAPESPTGRTTPEPAKPKRRSRAKAA